VDWVLDGGPEKLEDLRVLARESGRKPNTLEKEAKQVVSEREFKRMYQS
jgi:hypothetical protein